MMTESVWEKRALWLLLEKSLYPQGLNYET
jgi:hypothetical protein